MCEPKGSMIRTWSTMPNAAKNLRFPSSILLSVCRAEAASALWQQYYLVLLPVRNWAHPSQCLRHLPLLLRRETTTGDSEGK